jgi:hypothetical protein
VLSGQRRVPLPPARITALKCSILDFYSFTSYSLSYRLFHAWYARIVYAFNRPVKYTGPPVLFRSALFQDYVKVVFGCLSSPLRPSVKKRPLLESSASPCILYTYVYYQDIIQEGNVKNGHGKYDARARYTTPGCVHRKRQPVTMTRIRSKILRERGVQG